jgi:hypothetical protein
MAYSGTTQRTKINVAQLIEFAFRDSGKLAEEQTPELVNAARQALFYILQSLSNKGLNLWAIETLLLGAVQAQTVLPLPLDTVDVLEANWRYVQTPQVSVALPADNITAYVPYNNQSLNLFATTTISENYFGWGYQQAQIITQVGFNAYAPSGTATYNLVLETSDDGGVTWTTRTVLPELTLADKEWYYFQIDPSPQHVYYRLRETVASTFGVRAIVPSYVQQDIPMARLNRSTYFALPNKQFQSQRSLQYWYNKGVEQELYLWPIPQDNFQCYQIVIEKELQDVGTLTDDIYAPNRWMNAIQCLLSHRVAMQVPGVSPDKITYLERISKEALVDAGNGEEDMAPIYFQPNISYYTR